MVNINSVQTSRQSWPSWNQRGRLKKADPQGNVLEGQYACNGEIVAVSPRYQRSGMNFRVRPENPAAFFAAWCYENGLLPELLTPTEANEEWALSLMDPIWHKNRYRFPVLASPFAACDSATLPSHRIGFSFNVLQVLVEPINTPAGSHARSPVGTNGTNGTNDLEAAKKVIEAMRARARATQPAVPDVPVPDTTEEQDRLLAELAGYEEPEVEHPTQPSRRGRRQQS